MEINEPELIKTIVGASDWEEVLSTIIVEENLDPLDINIVKLTNAFMEYLGKVQSFDFRIPARFILIAAILLSMKCEILLEKEEEEEFKDIDLKQINLNSPMLALPSIRRPTIKIMLDELVSALNKALEMKKKKESKIFVRREINIVEAEDIEEKISSLYEKIKNSGMIRFSDIVPTWKRKDIIETFIPLLHLTQRGKILCEQDEMFKDIFIKLK